MDMAEWVYLKSKLTFNYVHKQAGEQSHVTYPKLHTKEIWISTQCDIRMHIFL